MGSWQRAVGSAHCKLPTANSKLFYTFAQLFERAACICLTSCYWIDLFYW